jgi:Family of unknown function (DUF5715)
MPTSHPRSSRGLAFSVLGYTLVPFRPSTPRHKEKQGSRQRAAHGACAAAVVLIGVFAAAPARPATAQSLQGSHESLLKQNLVASQHDYAYYRTPRDVEQAIAAGVLVEVHGNGDFELESSEVSYPYARPEVGVFLAQLGAAYHSACGEPLVVTSLTRPITRQPWNASPLSVHPTGMAVDMRRSARRGCRDWMESTLLALEGEGMVQATREHWPAHYHVAVFPDPLLLPGPLGDPNGVVRLAALHHEGHGILHEVDTEPAGRVRVARSASTGRLRISQTGAAVASRRPARSGRISVRRAAKTRHRATRTSAVPAVAHHRSHATAQARSVAAR